MRTSFLSAYKGCCLQGEATIWEFGSAAFWGALRLGKFELGSLLGIGLILLMISLAGKLPHR